MPINNRLFAVLILGQPMVIEDIIQNAHSSLPLSIRLSAGRFEQKLFQVFFVQSCRIMEYCCKKNEFNFGVDPITNS